MVIYRAKIPTTNNKCKCIKLCNSKKKDLFLQLANPFSFTSTSSLRTTSLAGPIPNLPIMNNLLDHLK